MLNHLKLVDIWVSNLAGWKTFFDFKTLISSLDIREFYFEMKKHSVKIIFVDNGALAKRKKK